MSAHTAGQQRGAVQLPLVTTVSTGGAEPQAIGANDQDVRPGTDVGEYRVEGVLGKGGFGTVYAGVQPVIGKRVAIKVLARKYSADPEIVSRFVAEAKAVNQIRHRNIIDIFSFGQLPDGRHYYVMEYLDGEPLDVHIRKHGPMSLDDALPILRSIARALDAAHAKGIAHRDLKPENIFLAQDTDGAQFPKLLDFGIAKLLAPEDDVRHKTGTGVPLGTPYYMSPEQCRGREIDHRTDIYSFGIVAYRLLTGTFPFEGDDYMELLFKQTNEEPPPPSSRNPALGPAVDEAIAWMMRKDREQRPPNVVEGVNALDPNQAVTPANLPKRSSKPSVAPARGPLAGAKTSSPDALAATFTPEFERVSAPELTPPKKRRGGLIVIGVLVLAAGGAAAFFALNGGAADRPASAPIAAPAGMNEAPPAAPTPTLVPAPAAPAGANTGSSEAAAPESADAAPAKARPKKPTKKSTGKVTTKQPSPRTDDPPSNKGDMIHLGSATFGKDSPAP
jgi:serine/threonine-protein kinase